MIKLRHYRYNLFPLALAIVWTAGSVWAQDYFVSPNAAPVTLDHKQAAKMIVEQAKPEYPPVAKVNYIEGQVRLELTVDGKGKVHKAHVVEGNALLAESALKATSRWIYRPLAKPTGPAGFITTVRVKFSLYNRGTDTVLSARQAEKDFLRQVKPPQVVRPPEEAPRGELVHMRVLVNDQGQVVDSEVSPSDRAKFDIAREALRNWTFRPAHWGNLPIASYTDVDVPVNALSTARAAANSDDD